MKKETIDGGDVLTFTPNTITYAVATDSKLANTISAAKMGIVFHTSYSGKTLKGLKASFGVSVKGLKRAKSVWVDDATFKNVSGRALFTAGETKQAQKALPPRKQSLRK